MGYVPIGKIVSYHCTSVGVTRWFFSSMDKSSTTKLISFKPNLTIFSVTLNDAGFYYCYGSFYHNLHFISVTQLKVLGECMVIIYYSNIV